MAYVVNGPFITGSENACGNIVLRANHDQIVTFLADVAANLGVEIRWYRAGHVPTAASANHHGRVISFDRGLADRLAVIHGPAAVVFVLLHEVGHLADPARGRAGERRADAFAAVRMVDLGFSIAEIVAAAAATLRGTVDDGVHDPGDVRLRAIAEIARACSARERRARRRYRWVSA